MKYLLFMVGLMVAVCSYGQTKKTTKSGARSGGGQGQYQMVSYRIEGTAVDFLDGEWVRLCNPTAEGLSAYDSTQVWGEKFSFSGKTRSIPHLQYIAIGTGTEKNVTEVFLEKGTINVALVAGKKTDKVTGTVTNNAYTPYRDTMNVLYSNLYASIAESLNFDNSDDDREAYKAGAELVKKDMVRTTYDFASKNMGNWTGIYLLGQYYKQFTKAENRALLGKLPKKFQNLPLITDIRKYINNQK